MWKSALAGAAAGGLWGAMVDDVGVVGGALSGAAVGAMGSRFLGAGAAKRYKGFTDRLIRSQKAGSSGIEAFGRGMATNAGMSAGGMVGMLYSGMSEDTSLPGGLMMGMALGAGMGRYGFGTLSTMARRGMMSNKGSFRSVLGESIRSDATRMKLMANRGYNRVKSTLGRGK